MLPIFDIITRSISGYVFIIPFCILYFLYLNKTGRKQSIPHIIAVLVFCYYLLGILTVTGIGYTRTIVFQPNISLIPIVGMITGPIDTILNIILFIPMGFFLPLLYKKFSRLNDVVLYGFLFSLAVEVVQMFGWGSSDINDLITNTIGVCIGYWVSKLLCNVLPNSIKNQLYAKNINDMTEALLFVVCTFVIMITAQRWVVHTAFNILYIPI